MSYKKMMRSNAAKIRRGHFKMRTRTGTGFMGFTTLSANERRRAPLFSQAFIEEATDKEIKQMMTVYNSETERLLKENPDLEIV